MRCVYQSFLIALSLGISGVAVADKNDVVRGQEVGKEMPLHVVHFVAGARKEGKGCPSTMISNGQARGLELWVSSPSEQAFAFAGEFEPALDADLQDQAFMIVRGQISKEGLVELAKKHGVNKTTVCVPNSKKLFQNAKFSKEHDLIVFFMDRKQIKARYNLRASELDSDGRQRIVDEFKQFLSQAK